MTTTKLETIYDHNVTNAEMIGLFDMIVELSTLQKASQRRNYEFIFRLYYEMRKDKSTAMKYADLIPNDHRKIFSLLWNDRG